MRTSGPLLPDLRWISHTAPADLTLAPARKTPSVRRKRLFNKALGVKHGRPAGHLIFLCGSTSRPETGSLHLNASGAIEKHRNYCGLRDVSPTRHNSMISNKKRNLVAKRFLHRRSSFRVVYMCLGCAK